MKLIEYMDMTRSASERKPEIFNREKYAKVYEECRRLWNYAPVEIDKICRIAEQLKTAGIPKNFIKDSEIIDVVERFIQDTYISTRNRDKRIYRAVARYKRCLDYGFM